MGIRLRGPKEHVPTGEPGIGIDRGEALLDRPLEAGVDEGDLTAWRSDRDSAALEVVGQACARPRDVVLRDLACDASEIGDLGERPPAVPFEVLQGTLNHDARQDDLGAVAVVQVRIQGAGRDREAVAVPTQEDDPPCGVRRDLRANVLDHVVRDTDDERAEILPDDVVGLAQRVRGVRVGGAEPGHHRAHGPLPGHASTFVHATVPRRRSGGTDRDAIIATGSWGPAPGVRRARLAVRTAIASAGPIRPAGAGHHDPLVFAGAGRRELPASGRGSEPPAALSGTRSADSERGIRGLWPAAGGGP
jgi:hypothetical protein